MLRLCRGANGKGVTMRDEQSNSLTSLVFLPPLWSWTSVCDRFGPWLAVPIHLKITPVWAAIANKQKQATTCMKIKLQETVFRVRVIMIILFFHYWFDHLRSFAEVGTLTTPFPWWHLRRRYMKPSTTKLCFNSATCPLSLQPGLKTPMFSMGVGFIYYCDNLCTLEKNMLLLDVFL